MDLQILNQINSCKGHKLNRIFTEVMASNQKQPSIKEIIEFSGSFCVKFYNKPKYNN